MPVPDLSLFRFDREESLENRLSSPPPIEKIPTPKRPGNWSGPLAPLLEPGLNIVFVGFNPGIKSGETGHHYAHPSNRFWKYLFWSGFTPKLHTPNEDVKLPHLYRIGFTDLVARSTKGIQQLTKEEMIGGVSGLNQRIAEVSPKAVCLVGKGIWEAMAKANNWDKKKFKYGFDELHKVGNEKSALFCVPSTSGLNSISPEIQLEAWVSMRIQLEYLVDKFEKDHKT